MKSEHKLILWLDKHFYITRFLSSRIKILYKKNSKETNLYEVESFLENMILDSVESRRISMSWYKHTIEVYVQKKRKLL